MGSGPAPPENAYVLLIFISLTFSTKSFFWSYRTWDISKRYWQKQTYSSLSSMAWEDSQGTVHREAVAHLSSGNIWFRGLSCSCQSLHVTKCQWSDSLGPAEPAPKSYLIKLNWFNAYQRLRRSSHLAMTVQGHYRVYKRPDSYLNDDFI